MGFRGDYLGTAARLSTDAAENEHDLSIGLASPAQQPDRDKERGWTGGEGKGWFFPARP